MQMQAMVESSKNFLFQKYNIAQQKQWLSIFHEIFSYFFPPTGEGYFKSRLE